MVIKKEQKYRPICDKFIDECICMSCHGLRNNNAMFKPGEAQDVERVAYLLSINVSVEKALFKNRPIR